MTAWCRAALGCTAVRKMSAPSWSRSSIVNLSFGMGHSGGGDGGGIEIGGICLGHETDDCCEALQLAHRQVLYMKFLSSLTSFLFTSWFGLPFFLLV